MDGFNAYWCAPGPRPAADGRLSGSNARRFRRAIEAAAAAEGCDPSRPGGGLNRRPGRPGRPDRSASPGTGGLSHQAENAVRGADVSYFHVVFTLPAALNPLALGDPREVYGLLMRAAAETLIEVAAEPRHLGAEVGVLAVLHTWGQNLELHPHVHCVVPGGGPSPDGTRWVGSRPGFFLPVRVLSRVFRGKFLAGLRAAFAAGRVRLAREPDPTAGRKEFERLVSEAVRTDWVVYAKEPFGGPEVVLKYLARYTHRAAISNHRLVEVKDGQVQFRWKDYAHGGRWRTMTTMWGRRSTGSSGTSWWTHWGCCWLWWSSH